MAPGTAAPIRDPSRNNFKSPLKKAARRIVTAPTFNVIRTIDFDKKSEYDKFIQFIDSSNKELAKIRLCYPNWDYSNKDYSFCKCCDWKIKIMPIIYNIQKVL